MHWCVCVYVHVCVRLCVHTHACPCLAARSGWESQIWGPAPSRAAVSRGWLRAPLLTLGGAEKRRRFSDVGSRCHTGLTRAGRVVLWLARGGLGPQRVPPEAVPVTVRVVLRALRGRTCRAHAPSVQRPVVLVPQTRLTVRRRPVPLWPPRDEGGAGGCWVRPAAPWPRRAGTDAPRAPGPRPPCAEVVCPDAGSAVPGALTEPKALFSSQSTSLLSRWPTRGYASLTPSVK